MSALLRLIRCVLGIASPSRVAILLYGGTSPMGTWLDRWERRINADAARRGALVMFREEVQIVGRWTGNIVHRVDVTGRSDRAQRRVLNKWRRRVTEQGMFVRLVTSVRS